MAAPATAPRKAQAGQSARKAPARGRRPSGPVRGGMALVAWVAAGIFVLDQALKYLVVHVLNLDRVREIDVLPPWLNLRMAWNQGVNFGLMASETDLMRWVLIGVALVICVWVWIWVWRAALGRLARIAAGMLIGGALGNVVDRVLYGAVADFLNMSLPNWQNPYSFNVADIAIFAGAIGLVLLPQPAPPATTRKGRTQSGKAPARNMGKTAGKTPAKATGRAGVGTAQPAVAPRPDAAKPQVQPDLFAEAPETPRPATEDPRPPRQGRDGDGNPR